MGRGFGDDLESFFFVGYDLPKRELLFDDGLVSFHGNLFQPVFQGLPKAPADENNGNLLVQPSRRDESADFKELVQGAKTAREKDISLGGVSQHDFSHKKVMKADALLHIGVALLNVGKLQSNT